MLARTILIDFTKLISFVLIDMLDPESPCIFSLVPDVLRLVFSNLSTSCLLRAAAVCREWRVAARDDILWLRLRSLTRRRPGLALEPPFTISENAEAIRGNPRHFARGKLAPLSSDDTLGGGLSIFELVAHAPTKWPRYIAKHFFKELKLVPFDSNDHIISDEMFEEQVNRWKPPEAVQVVYTGNNVGDDERSVVSNQPFPRIYSTEKLKMNDYRRVWSATIPFVWAPSVGLTTSSQKTTPQMLAVRRRVGVFVVAYYEISILSSEGKSDKDGSSSHNHGCVAVGLATKSYTLKSKLPGWTKDSYGYHGDDGLRFHGSGIGKRFGPKFGQGDSVGVGLVYLDSCTNGPQFSPPLSERHGVEWVDQCKLALAVNRSAPAASIEERMPWPELSFEEIAKNWPRSTRRGASIFYTLNGTFLGPAFTGVDVQKSWYPCVGIDGLCPVKFNFGADARNPFLYDVRSLNEAFLAKSCLPHFPLSLSIKAEIARAGRAQFSGPLSVAPPPPAANLEDQSKSSLSLSSPSSPSSPYYVPSRSSNAIVSSVSAAAIRSAAAASIRQAQLDRQRLYLENIASVDLDQSARPGFSDESSSADGDGDTSESLSLGTDDSSSEGSWALRRSSRRGLGLWPRLRRMRRRAEQELQIVEPDIDRDVIDPLVDNWIQQNFDAANVDDENEESSSEEDIDEESEDDDFIDGGDDEDGEGEDEDENNEDGDEEDDDNEDEDDTEESGDEGILMG